MNYLAAPYSDPDPAVREARYQAICAATAFLLREGFFVYSPITHSHPLNAWGLPTAWLFWEAYDRWYLARCRELWVLRLLGWERSHGVREEMAIAASLGKPIRHLQPLDGSIPRTGGEGGR